MIYFCHQIAHFFISLRKSFSPTRSEHYRDYFNFIVYTSDVNISDVAVSQVLKTKQEGRKKRKLGARCSQNIRNEEK